MAGIDPFLSHRTRRVIESEEMPLRTRLAAAHGDADQAARLLEEAARAFHLDIERLMVAHELPENPPAAARRGLRFGLRARNTGSSPALPGRAATPAVAS